jgi:hypothetical protein
MAKEREMRTEIFVNTMPIPLPSEPPRHIEKRRRKAERKKLWLQELERRKWERLLPHGPPNQKLPV